MNEITCLKVYKKIKKQLYANEILKNLKIKVFLGGSVAKKTSVDYSEIDIFIKSKDSTAVYDTILTMGFGGVAKVAISKYLRFEYNGILVDLVPITNDNSNSSYYSIYHVAYVKKKLKDPTQVLRLKKYLLTHHIYHNVSGGISGYICELLVIKFEKITKENIKEVIEYLKVIKDPIAPLRQLYAAINREVLNKLYILIIQNIGYGLIPLLQRSQHFRLLKVDGDHLLLSYLKILQKHNIFILFINTGASLYILYYNLKVIINVKEQFNEPMDLSQIKKTRYISFETQYIFTNLLIFVDLSRLESVKQTMNDSESNEIYNLFNRFYLTNLKVLNIKIW